MRIYPMLGMLLVLSMNVGSMEAYPTDTKTWSQEDLNDFAQKAIPMGIAEFKQHVNSTTLPNNDQMLGAFLQLFAFKSPSISWSDLRNERAKKMFLLDILLQKFPKQKQIGGYFWVETYKNNDRQMVRFLKSRGVNASHALRAALEQDMYDSIPRLIKDGGRPDDFLRFKFSSHKENAAFRSVLPKLLQAMRNINMRDEDGMPLWFTVNMYKFDTYDKEIVDALIRAGININAQDSSGNTRLTKLIDQEGGGSSYADAVSYLFKHGANPNIKNKKGESALSIAKKAGLADLVVLFESKAARRARGR